MRKKISILCTAFRDGFQSVFGARVLSKDYMPVVKKAVQAGLTNIESGGGASFQSAFFYNNENAFDVMDMFRQTAGKTVNLQTLSRGVNVVGLESQSSELINLHAKLFKKHGVTTIRNFDALNDANNLLYSGKCIVQAGLKHQLSIAMMSLPPKCQGAHTTEFYIQVLRNFIKKKIPFDSLCFKDASGTTIPSTVYDTIMEARKIVGEQIPIEFHSHETAGTGLVCYLAAIDAGADCVDLSMAPVSGGTCQPDIVSLWHALRGNNNFELDVDVDAVLRVEKDLIQALSAYFIPPEAQHVEPLIPFSPMPGGALTANTQMLRDNNLMDKYAEIIKEMEEVVLKGGFGTSVTPVSQFYFQQAFNNVIYGKWKKIADGYGKMVLGYFGKTPVAPDKKIIEIAAQQLGLPVVDKPVLEINDANPNKTIAHYKEVLKKENLPITDENIFIVATCGEKGIAFLHGKGTVQVRYKETQTALKQTSVSVPERITLDGKEYQVSINGNTVTVDGKKYDFLIGGKKQEAQVQQSTAPKTGMPHNILSGTPGVITDVNVQVGDSVSVGDIVCSLEVMKMKMDIKANKAGTVQSVLVSKGTAVTAEQPLIILD